jgi:hypothetical protein
MAAATDATKHPPRRLTPERGLLTSFSVARAGACLAALAIFAWTLAFSIPELRTVTANAFQGPAAAAATLSHAQGQIPADAEVIASQGVMGRFGDRHAIYQLTANEMSFPVVPGRPVVFVLVPSLGIELTTPAGVEHDIDHLVKLPGIRILGRSPEATVLEWTPPRGVHRVSLPSGATG